MYTAYAWMKTRTKWMTNWSVLVVTGARAYSRRERTGTYAATGSLNLPSCCMRYMRSPPLTYSITKYSRSWNRRTTQSTNTSFVSDFTHDNDPISTHESSRWDRPYKKDMLTKLTSFVSGLTSVTGRISYLTVCFCGKKGGRNGSRWANLDMVWHAPAADSQPPPTTLKCLIELKNNE